VEAIAQLTQEDKVQAIGEIGLDYYWLKQSPETTPSKEEQQAAFRAQMALAESRKLPVIVHDRDAHADCLAIVKEFPQVRGVYHCYSGSYETAKELIALGWMLSFTGVITHDNSKKVRRILQNIPLECIMIETDSPYMTPAQYKKKGERVRNSSLYVHCVADKIAEICGRSREEVERITTENGKRFFGIA
jgi:TatD DNase family protein